MAAELVGGPPFVSTRRSAHNGSVYIERTFDQFGKWAGLVWVTSHLAFRHLERKETRK